MTWIDAIVGTVAVSLFGRELWAWLPGLSRLVIWLGTATLASERRAIRRAEWSADLATVYDERRLAGLLWALGLVAVCGWERVTGSAAFAVVTARWHLVVGVVSASGLAVVAYDRPWAAFVLLALLAIASVPIGFGCGIFVVLLVALAWDEHQEKKRYDRIANLSLSEFIMLVDDLARWCRPGSTGRQVHLRLRAELERQLESGATTAIPAHAVREVWRTIG